MWDCFPASAAFRREGWSCWKEREREREEERGCGAWVRVGQGRTEDDLMWEELKRSCGMRSGHAALPVTMTAYKYNIDKCSNEPASHSDTRLIQPRRSATKSDHSVLEYMKTDKLSSWSPNTHLCWMHAQISHILEQIKTFKAKRSFLRAQQGSDYTAHLKWSRLIRSMKGSATRTILSFSIYKLWMETS